MKSYYKQIRKTLTTQFFKKGQGTWTSTSKKKLCRWPKAHELCKWPINIWQCTQFYQSSEKCTLKLHWNTTAHWPEWLKLKGLKIPWVGVVIVVLDIVYITGGSVNYYNHLENYLSSPLKPNIHTQTLIKLFY